MDTASLARLCVLHELRGVAEHQQRRRQCGVAEQQQQQQRQQSLRPAFVYIPAHKAHIDYLVLR